MKTKTGLEKMVEWLEVMVQVNYSDQRKPVYESALDKARSMLAEESQESTDGGLVEKVQQWIVDFRDVNKHILIDDLINILSHHAQAKPTADKGLVDELKDWWNRRPVMYPSDDSYNKGWTTQFNEILSRYTAVESRANNGLLAELDEFIPIQCEKCKMEIFKIISRYSPTEILAELADRKGITNIVFRTWEDKQQSIILQKWIGLKYHDEPNTKDIWDCDCKTYAEAESKARTYLESLPEVIK